MSAAVQIARAAGLTVIGTAGTDRGRALVREQGAHHVLDHGADGYRDEIKRITNGRGPDVIVEMLANVNLNHDLVADRAAAAASSSSARAATWRSRRG